MPTRISAVNEHREPEEWVKCAIKLFRMVGVLHRRGYQRLRVSPTAREMWWRCAIAPAKIFSSENGALIEQETPSMTARFGSGSGCTPFEWGDSILHLQEEDLADRFARSFPIILRESAGRDWAYAGWYQELLNTLGTEGVPIAHYADSYEDELYNPLRIFAPGLAKGGVCPLPPIFHPDDDSASPGIGN